MYRTVQRKEEMDRRVPIVVIGLPLPLLSWFPWMVIGGGLKANQQF
jgi:hypothetical protein